MARPSEFSLIDRYFSPLAGDGSFNLRDDAARYSPKAGHDLVITQDAIAEGIHFFPDDPPDLIARKALRVNLSDLAAKGAAPISYSLALGLGETWNEDWIAGFANGLEVDQKTYGISLKGGDTFRTGGGFVISVTAIGEMPSGKYVSRLGAGEGDQIYVTGTIGDGALGLLARQGKLNLDEEHLHYLTDRYLLPQPRMSAAELVQEYASAAMDISDGLVADAGKLAAASQVGISLNVDTVPLSAAGSSACHNDADLLEQVLTGGDDYEILATIPAEKTLQFDEAASRVGISFTQIGIVTKGNGVLVLDREGKSMSFSQAGYNHSGQGI